MILKTDITKIGKDRADKNPSKRLRESGSQTDGDAEHVDLGVACVIGDGKYLGERKNWHARGKHARREGAPAREAHENRFPPPPAPITWLPLRDLLKILTGND